MELKMMVYDEKGLEIKVSDKVEINACYGDITGKVVGIYPHAIEVKFGEGARGIDEVEYKNINSITIISEVE